MKILHIVDSLRIGGAETIVVDLVGSLSEAGHEVEVAYFTDGPYRGDLESRDIRCHRLSHQGLRDPFAWWRAFRVIGALAPDVVHTHLVKSDVFGQPAALLRRVPARIVSVHNTSPWFRRRRFRWPYRLLTVGATDVIAVGHGVEQYVRDLAVVRPTRLTTIENGTDLDRFAPMSDRTPRCGPVVIGAVGRLEPQKDHATLLHAMRTLNERGCDARLVIHGDGSLRDELHELTSELGLDDRVELAGISRDMPGTYRELDVLTFSSTYEGLPMALLEGMAVGIPVAATAVGSVPDVITDGENGLLVRPADPSALADALERLVDDPTLRTTFGTAGRRRVVESYSDRSFHSRLTDVYRSRLDGLADVDDARTELEVVMVTTMFTPFIGGAERMVEDLARGLARRGHMITVLTRAYDPALASTEQLCDGVTVRRIPARGPRPIASVGFTVGAAAHIALRHRSAHVVHAHQLFSPATVAWLVTRVGGTRFIATPHRGGPDGDVGRLRRRRGGRTRLRLLARAVDLFTAISSEIRDELVSVHVPEAKIHDVANGVDQKRFAPPTPTQRSRMRSNLAIEPDDVAIGFVARIESIKGIETVLDVAARRHDLTVIIAGSGSLEPLVAEIAATHPNVRWLGARSDVDDLLHAFDLWVLPSHGEGLPLGLLEAMSTGLPVISTPVGAVPEVIVDGYNGALVPPGDAAALESAIDRTLAEGCQFGERARETVVGGFSLTTMVDEYESLYRSAAR